MAYNKYIPFIQENLEVLSKDTREYVPFILNKIQSKFMSEASGADIILKARQQGFSSLILALFATDFILQDNTLSVVVADITDNALDLLARVKGYIRSYEKINGFKIPLKYNSKYELQNGINGSRYIIGTAENTKFGRSKTITNLHLSEAAFYPKLKDILAGAGTALVPNGKFIIETTANGFNEFKDLWDESVAGLNTFKPLFYKASDFYTPEFLTRERLRLGRLFPQEYPETALEAFLNSGNLYFDNEALKYHAEFANKYKEKFNVPSISAI